MAGNKSYEERIAEEAGSTEGAGKGFEEKAV